MIETISSKTTEEAAAKAVSRLNQIFDAHSHIPILFLSSGGSSLALLDEIKIIPSNFTLGVTDERFSKDEKVNNFAQLSETKFFENAREHGTYFIDTRVQAGEDIELLAKRFENALHRWREEHPGGRIVITQGVGSDGHTAGIMPYPKEKETFLELFEGERWVQGYDAKDKNEYPLRVTITLPFLRMIDHSVLYVTGVQKKDAFSHMTKIKGMLWEMPSRIIHEMKEVTIFTDIQ
jgi:6-phosphogluconolactonase/glucosamine-6-phosphate isomerase/deaminase